MVIEVMEIFGKAKSMECKLKESRKESWRLIILRDRRKEQKFSQDMWGKPD